MCFLSTCVPTRPSLFSALLSRLGSDKPSSEFFFPAPDGPSTPDELARQTLDIVLVGPSLGLVAAIPLTYLPSLNVRVIGGLYMRMTKLLA